MTLTTRSEMRHCGKPFPSAEAAMNSKRGQGGGFHAEQCPLCPDWHLRRTPAGVRTVKPAARDTGFSAAVKLQIRERAQFCCEACGVFLGEKCGQCQHIVARGSGGTSDPVIDSVVNGALLCGTPFTGCHGLCEARDPRMEAEGFWLKRGKDPAAESFLWHAPEDGSGFRLWRTTDGQYSDVPPRERAA